MKKLLVLIFVLAYVVVCKAQLSAADCKYVLEIFCRSYYSSCFDGKAYVPNTLILNYPQAKDLWVVQIDDVANTCQLSSLSLRWMYPFSVIKRSCFFTAATLMSASFPNFSIVMYGFSCIA